MTAPSALATARNSFLAGYGEFRALFNPLLWLGGWVTRLVFQAVFFSMVGSYVGGPALVRYILIGNVLGVIALEGAAMAHAAYQQRHSGLLTLMLSTPANQVAAMLARDAIRIVLGWASSTIVFVALVLVFRVPLPWPDGLLVLPILLVVSLACYCYGCLVATLVYRFEFLNRSATNLAYLTVTVLAGINVPISFWPLPLRLCSEVLPVTHGLVAVRTLLAGGAATTVLGQVLLEIVVGAGWLTLAIVALRRAVEADRRSGRLEL